MKKLLRFHQSRHEVDVDAGVVNLSYDGVEATKSCHRSFEVLSAKFENCRVVYPLAIGIAESGYATLMTAPRLMKSTISDLTDLGISIKFFILDHPKRCGRSLKRICSKLKF